MHIWSGNGNKGGEMGMIDSLFVVVFVAVGCGLDLLLVSLKTKIDTKHLLLMFGSWGFSLVLTYFLSPFDKTYTLTASIVVAPALGRLLTHFYIKSQERADSINRGRSALARHRAE